jgi:tRNA(Ile)-lysidine synthetase-like protein
MLQKITGQARRSIDDYNMIEEGDKIAIGLSGGKDSITLLHVLYTLKRYYPKKFEMIAITIHPGNQNFKTDKLEKMCKDIGVEYIVYKSNITDVVFNIRKEKNPCSLCANMRRGMLNSIAIEHGCTKIALGHHSDDVIETFLMSIFLNGKIHSFSPVTYLSRSNLKVIRPLIYTKEKDIFSLAKKNNFPVIGSCCQKDGFTKREYMKDLIKTLKKDIPKVKENLMGAIIRSEIPGWEKNARDN